MKKLIPALFIIVPVLSIALFQISSCSKSSKPSDPEAPKCPVIPPVCDIRGTYTGTSTDNGMTSQMTYQLEDNNFAVGSSAPGSSPVTYGSYTNTCDSVRLTVFYTSNNDYYLLTGKLTNTTIAGTFKNLTLLSDSGTFTITK